MKKIRGHGIYRYVASRLGRDVADDIAAETFHAAFRKRDRFDPARGTVWPWLYAIATNLVGQHQRDEKRRYEALARAAGTDQPPDGHQERVTDRVVAEGVRPQLAGALAALPDGDRDALLLIAVGGLHEQRIISDPATGRLLGTEYVIASLGHEGERAAVASFSVAYSSNAGRAAASLATAAWSG
ncbi:RNA polymerase sigma factor [Actinomadura rudentiformis]|uniref:RNA polymerase sigma factor n=1 Tax=Actinomadura rudentiformis TaxID=359158 RepID=A0A6H9ZA55_9ACTN|nr:RNA polymerase sigma factor [Actinomadura rudentiformis]KAB2352343.1 RNA polymerase sigma factor [Actinomadura rudentiformis]